MWTCNQLDLQTPVSQPVMMPKNLLDHWQELLGLIIASLSLDVLEVYEYGSDIQYRSKL